VRMRMFGQSANKCGKPINSIVELLIGITSKVPFIRIIGGTFAFYGVGVGRTRTRISGQNALNRPSFVTKVNNLGSKAGKLPPIYGPRIQLAPTYGGIQRGY